ncbi:MAG TPA: Flp family type IVb pilin [Sphingobium sp.]|nr:Flp family type IVb pilin [Sphingobium sp.]
MTRYIHALARRLARDEKGLAAVEYAVLGSIVVGAIVAIGGAFETNLQAAFTSLFNSIL